MCVGPRPVLPSIPKSPDSWSPLACGRRFFHYSAGGAPGDNHRRTTGEPRAPPASAARHGRGGDMAGEYQAAYQRSLRDPEGFWGDAARAIDWIKPWDRGLDDAKPRVIVAASCGIEPGRVVPYKPLLDAALAMATFKPERCLIVQRPEERASMAAGRDVDWHDAVARAQPADCVPVAATDP